MAGTAPVISCKRPQPIAGVAKHFSTWREVFRGRDCLMQADGHHPQPANASIDASGNVGREIIGADGRITDGGRNPFLTLARKEVANEAD